jgi:predicted dinucleotide-binding enzyme
MNRVIIFITLGLSAAWPGILLAEDRETIAVIGTGDMGDSFGPRLAALGYRIVYGSRDPGSDKVTALVEKTGHGASATTQREAAQHADIVLLAVPWPAMETVAQNLGDLDGKILIDISWPPAEYAKDGYERITIDSSAAELIQGWNPSAMVAKAFLTVGSNVIDDPSYAGGPVSIPIASDYRIAKEKTGQIAADLGLDPVDAGPLRFARNIEAMTELLLVPYAQGRDAGWNFYFRRTNYFRCNPYEGDGSDTEAPPTIDAGNLATMPETQPPLKPCKE